VGQNLALPGKLAAGRQRICALPHRGFAEHQRSPVVASIDAFGLASWGSDCLIEIKHRTDSALALEQLAQCLLNRTAEGSANSPLDEQLLALP